MVAPLFLLALWWERRDWQTSRLLRPRSLTWRIGGVRRTVSGTGLASGLLLVAMGGATVWIALTGSPMAPAGGWQARLSAWVQHAGTVVVRALAWLPGWAAWLLLATAAGLLAWRASGRSAGGTPAPAKRAVSNPRRQVMSTKSPKPSGRARPPETGRPDGRPAARRPRRPRGRLRGGLPAGVKVAAFAGLAVIGLLAVFLVTNRGGRSQQGTGRYAYQVGDPGPGATAPPIRLEATDGKVFDLAAPPGQTTLLYFQEGLGCQPCWDQLTDIQTNLDKYKALGITRILSITTDPLDAIRQKVTDQHITIPVAADPDLTVSRAYHANQYGMMGQSRDGHSFILVGPTAGSAARRLRRRPQLHHVRAQPQPARRPSRRPRRAAAMTRQVATVEVLLLTQEHCSLCEHAKHVLDRLATEHPLRITVVDLATAEGRALAADGGILFPPGLFLDGEPFSHGRLSERKLRRELDRHHVLSEITGVALVLRGLIWALSDD